MRHSFKPCQTAPHAPLVTRLVLLAANCLSLGFTVDRPGERVRSHIMGDWL